MANEGVQFEPEMTACKNCKHHRPTDGASRWYDHRCGAVRCPSTFDPVEGAMVEGELEHCRNVNRGGACPHFEEMTYTQRVARHFWGGPPRIGLKP